MSFSLCLVLKGIGGIYEVIIVWRRKLVIGEFFELQTGDYDW